MSVDIYGYLQVKRNNFWELLQGWEFDKSPTMFKIMNDIEDEANQRDGINRGIPEDLTEEIMDDLDEEYNWREGDDQEIFLSWLTYNDLHCYDWNKKLEVEKNYGKQVNQVKELVEPEWQTFFDRLKSLADDHGSNNVRIVYYYY